MITSGLMKLNLKKTSTGITMFRGNLFGRYVGPVVRRLSYDQIMEYAIHVQKYWREAVTHTIEIQDTSIEAYESVNRGNDSWYSQVLSALEDTPSTCDELEIALQGRHQTISSRIRKGVQDGYIKSTGEKRPTRTGRKAIIWKRII